MKDEKQLRKERSFYEKLKRSKRFTNVKYKTDYGIEGRKIYFTYDGNNWYLIVSKAPMDLVLKHNLDGGQVTIFEEFPSLKLLEDVLQNA